jgi:hypothetical protein
MNRSEANMMGFSYSVVGYVRIIVMFDLVFRYLRVRDLFYLVM